MTDRDRIHSDHRHTYMDQHTGDVYFDEHANHDHAHSNYPGGKLLRPNLDFMHQDLPRGIHSVTESAMDTKPENDDYFAPRQLRQPVEIRSTFSLSVLRDIRPTPLDLFTPSTRSSEEPAVELDNDYTSHTIYQEKEIDTNLAFTRPNAVESDDGSFEVIEDDSTLSDQDQEHFLVPSTSSGTLRDDHTGQELAGRLSKSLGSLRAYEQMLMEESKLEQLMTNLGVPDYDANQRQPSTSTLQFSFTQTTSTAGLSEALTLSGSYQQERSSNLSRDAPENVSYFQPLTYPRQQFDSVADQNWDQIDKALHMLADFRGLSSTDEDTSTLTDITSERSSGYTETNMEKTEADMPYSEQEQNSPNVSSRKTQKFESRDKSDLQENLKNDDDTLSRNTEETYLGPSEVSYFNGSLHDDSVNSEGDESYVDESQTERLASVVQQYRDKVSQSQSEQRASPLLDRQLLYSPLLPDRYYGLDATFSDDDLTLPSDRPVNNDNQDEDIVENSGNHNRQDEESYQKNYERELFPSNFSEEKSVNDNPESNHVNFDFRREEPTESNFFRNDILGNQDYRYDDQYLNQDPEDYRESDDHAFEPESAQNSPSQRNLFRSYVEEYQPSNDYSKQPVERFENRSPSYETFDRSEVSSFDPSDVPEVQNDSFVVPYNEQNIHVDELEQQTFVRDHSVPEAAPKYEYWVSSVIPQDSLEELPDSVKDAPEMDSFLQFSSEGSTITDIKSQHELQPEQELQIFNDVPAEARFDDASTQNKQSYVSEVADQSLWDYEELRFLSTPMLDYYDESALMDYGYSAERQQETAPSYTEDRMLNISVYLPRQETQAEIGDDIEDSLKERNEFHSDSLEDTTNNFYGQDSSQKSHGESDLSSEPPRREQTGYRALDQTKRAVEDAYQLLQTANQETSFASDNTNQVENLEENTVRYSAGNENDFEHHRFENDERNYDAKETSPLQTEDYSEKDSLDSDNLQQFNETLRKEYELEENPPINEEIEEYNRNDSVNSAEDNLQRYANDLNKGHEAESYQPFNTPTYEEFSRQLYNDNDSFGFSRGSQFNDNSGYSQSQSHDYADMREESTDRSFQLWQSQKSGDYREEERFENQQDYDEPPRAESPYFEENDAERMQFRSNYEKTNDLASDDQSAKSERYNNKEDSYSDVLHEILFDSLEYEGYSDVPLRDLQAKSPAYEFPEESQVIEDQTMENQAEDRTENLSENNETDFGVPLFITEQNLPDDTLLDEKQDDKFSEIAERSQNEEPGNFNQPTAQLSNDFGEQESENADLTTESEVDFAKDYVDDIQEYSRVETPYHEELDSIRMEFHDARDSEAVSDQADLGGSMSTQNNSYSNNDQFAYIVNENVEFERDSATPAMEYYRSNNYSSDDQMEIHSSEHPRDDNWPASLSESNNRFDEWRSHDRGFDAQNNYSNGYDRSYNEGLPRDREPVGYFRAESPYDHDEQFIDRRVTVQSSPPQESYGQQYLPAQSQYNGYQENIHSDNENLAERDNDFSDRFEQQVIRDAYREERAEDESPRWQQEDQSSYAESPVGISEVQYHVGSNVDEDTREEDDVEETIQDDIDIDTDVGYITALSTFIENPGVTNGDTENEQIIDENEQGFSAQSGNIRNLPGQQLQQEENLEENVDFVSAVMPSMELPADSTDIQSTERSENVDSEFFNADNFAGSITDINISFVDRDVQEQPSTKPKNVDKDEIDQNDYLTSISGQPVDFTEFNGSGNEEEDQNTTDEPGESPRIEQYHDETPSINRPICNGDRHADEMKNLFDAEVNEDRQSERVQREEFFERSNNHFDGDDENRNRDECERDLQYRDKKQYEQYEHVRGINGYDLNNGENLYRISSQNYRSNDFDDDNRFQEPSRNFDEEDGYAHPERQELTYNHFTERSESDGVQQTHRRDSDQERNTPNDSRFDEDARSYRNYNSDSLNEEPDYQRKSSLNLESGQETQEDIHFSSDEQVELDRREGVSTAESAEVFARDRASNASEDQDVRQPSFIYIGSEPDSEARIEADETPNDEDEDEEGYFNRIEPYYIVEDVDYQLADLVIPSIEPPESVLMDNSIATRTQWNLADHVNLSDLQEHYSVKASTNDILHSALDRLFSQQSLRDVNTGQFASSISHTTDLVENDVDSESESGSPSPKEKQNRVEEEFAELSDGSASLTSGDTHSAKLRRKTLKPSGQRSWYQLDNLPVDAERMIQLSQTALPVENIALSVRSTKIPFLLTGGYETERAVITSITSSAASPSSAAQTEMIAAPPAQLSRSVESSGFEAPAIPAEHTAIEDPMSPRQAVRSAPPVPSARASRRVVTRPHGDLPQRSSAKFAALPSQAELHQAGDHRTVSQVWHFDRTTIEPYKNVLDIRPDEGTEPTAVLFFPCLLPDRALRQYDKIMDHLHKFVMSRLEEIEDKPFRIFVFNAAVPTGTEHAVTWIQHVHKSMDPEMKKNMHSLLIVHPNLKTKTELKTIGRAVLGKEFYNKIHFVKSLKDLSRMQSVQYAAIPKPVRDHDRRREWKLTKNSCGC